MSKSTDLKREQRIDEAKKRREAVHAELLVLRHTLETDYGVKHLPGTVRSMIWQYAYDVGHANGASEIELHYEDFADLAKVAYGAGMEYR